MISKDIYARLLYIQSAKPRTDVLRQEAMDINQTLLDIIPAMKPFKFLNTAIGMYEGSIPYDKFYRECKSCRVRYKAYRCVSEAKYHICKHCADKNIGWCYIHNETIVGLACQKCEVDASHIRHLSENTNSYVECHLCGLRAPILANHYSGTHKLSKDVYSKFDLVCEDRKESMRGSNNPAFQHGGRLSPFSKNFKNYCNEEEYQKGVTSVIAKANTTRFEHPENINTRIEFYLAQGMSQEDAEIALSERQTTFSIERCIEQYGEETGLKIWEDRQERWQNTLNSKSQEDIDLINSKKAATVDAYIARGFSVEVAEEMIRKTRANRNLGYSKESVRFFKSFIPDEIWEIAYHTTNEWFLYDKVERKTYFYDFMYNDVIVEYHGEAYHPNKDILTESQWIKWKHAKAGKSADAVYQYDQYKKSFAIQNGFKFFCVYSNDSLDRKESIKNEILEAMT